MPTYGLRPDDLVRDSRGDVAIDLVQTFYATRADAEMQVNPLGTATSAKDGRWQFTHPASGVFGRDPEGNVRFYDSEEPKLTEAVASSTYAAKPDNGARAVGKGELVVNAADYPSLQAAIDAAQANGGGPVRLGARTYTVTSTVLLPSHVWLEGANAGGQINGPCRIVYAGTAGGTVIGPKDRTIDTVNTGVRGVQVDGGGLADLIIDFYRVSYSALRDCLIMGTRAGGVGVLFDANVNNQCYFNVADHCKVSNVGTGVRFTRGANANRWAGGKIGNLDVGMEFLSLSAGNLVTGTDFETATTKHVYVDAASNTFLGVHMEAAPLGFDLTAQALSTRRFGSTVATNVTTLMQSATATEVSLDEESASMTALTMGATKISSNYLGAGTTVNFDARTNSGTSNSILQFFRNVNTTGTKQLAVYKGDGTSTLSLLVEPGNANLSLGSGVNVGGGKGVLGLTNRATVPTTDPVAGGVAYAESGALRWRTSGGTIRTVAGDVVAKSSTYIALPTERHILATGGASGITVQLPAATKGAEHAIKKVDAGAGAVTVSTTSSQTIDGATTKVLAAQYDTLRVVSDGTAWFII